MKRLLLLVLLLFLSTAELSAQRDTEHWIAPYYETSSNNGRSLYLSTDSVTPFVVTINSNNVPIGTVTISKGSPQVFAVDKQYIATSTATDALNVRTFGLHLVASTPFYCTLRLASSTTHAEILTSKGRAGIGNEFYVANTPGIYTGSTLFNFTAGVLATEDNTTVTVTWNNAPAPVFVSGNPPTNTQTFTLNKGQSYIYAGTGANASNLQSFIGAHIVSDKPITLTNGNNNGNFGTVTNSGSDIIMDQSVPVEKLGNTFAMVRTRSTSADMEGGIIIATEDNTGIFLNGSAVAVATINSGQWYRISGSNYINQGSGHFNMFVSTDKNVYLYQLVSVNNSSATGGFNYIPPLNCYLPRKIDEIGKVSEMPTAAGASQTSSGTIIKLNILTEAGAVVTINGTPTIATEGPFPVQGNVDWVTYSREGVTGNLTIESTKAVTAGINGGFSTSGYGGYFAGFSNIPLISRQTGVCTPGVVLEVDAGYLTYQWSLNGTPIAGATNNTYTPTIGGNYTCNITAGTCAPVTTPQFKVFSCLKQTTVNAVACAAVTLTPTFTSSTQTVVPSTVQIITAPTNGTAVIDPATGLITYTPNAGYIGVDMLVYKFCGNVPEFVDCEEVTVNFEVPTYPTVQNVTLTECYIVTNPTTALFDLGSAAVSPTAGVTYQYYPGLADAQNGTNEIFNFNSYIAPNSEVYVKVSNAGGCFKIAKITLVVTPPHYSTVLKDKYICVENRTTLDAGPGFDTYVWSTGEITQTINNVTVGEYWVDLETDFCITRQTVKVFKVPDPVISSIEITNNSATVTVVGGNAPYLYSIDNVNFQDSNVFNNLPRGQNTFYVKDSYNCIPVEAEVTVPNLINAITPNGDSVNDYVDYSELAYKKNLVFTVYDRYGNKIHTSDLNTGFKWGGTFNDRKIVTGTYWYSITWDEPNAKNPNNAKILYNGWILVKNRN